MQKQSYLEDIVEDLLANHDNAQLDGQLEEAAIRGARVGTESKQSVVVARDAIISLL